MPSMVDLVFQNRPATVDSAVPNTRIVAKDALALVRTPPNDAEVHIPVLPRVALPAH
ncbi:MAG: hypothetical protein ABSA16_09775 [Thermoguttaceae bacterium]